ncbi:MAG: DUF499 domain-containing protein [Desulfurococcaceae archaeon]
MTLQEVKPFTSVVKPREEVIKGVIEEAVNLANIFMYNELRGKHPEADLLTPSVLYNSEDFLRRTYVSMEIKNIILLVMGGLAGVSYVYLDEKGNRLPVSKRVIVIPSALGGGKTHLLATLYHVVKLYNEKKERVAEYFEDKKLKYGLSHVCKTLKEYGDVKVVVIAGDTRALAPTPDDPLVIDGYRVHTPWGLMGYLLGEYEKIRKADENQTPPTVDELRGLLRNKRVLILVDEAVEYMVRAVRLDAVVRGYSEAFLSFIRNLAVAVNETPHSVLVVTLPAEFREGGIGRSFQHPEYVERINSMLQRVAPEYHSPLVFEKDISAVFRKRLFENIDSEQVKRNVELVLRQIRERVEVDAELRNSIKAKYQDVLLFFEKLKETYPFHPYFIELIVNIAVRNPGLGLTRYLLAFVSRLVKYIYDSKEKLGRDPALSLITPWIIPLEYTEFREELLRGMISELRAEFNRIYEQDVRSHASRIRELIFQERSLDRNQLLTLIKGCIATTVWLSTIPGQGTKRSEAIKIYLAKDELPSVIYDPIAHRDAIGADVINTLNDLLNTSTYLVLTPDEKVFYATIPDVLAIVRQKYLGLTDFDALRRLELLVTRVSFRRGEHIKDIVPITMSREIEIENIVARQLEGRDDPVLVIYMGLEDPPSSIADIVLVRNNIVLLLPDFGVSPEQLGLHYTERIRRVIGSEPGNMKDYIKSLLKLLRAVESVKEEREFLRELAGEENLNYVQSVLENIKSEVEKHLVISIYSVLRKAVAGRQKKVYDVDLRPYGDESEDLSILCRRLEEYLEKRGVITEWDWSDIVEELRDWSDVWDLDKSPKKFIKVGEIWTQLLESQNVKPHLTGFKDFEKALRIAYLGRKIAFKYNGEILWLNHPYSPGEAEKKIKTGLPLCDWDRDVLDKLKRMNGDLRQTEIVSPRYIIKEYIQKLKKKAEVKPGERVIRKLVVYKPDARIELDEFLAVLKSEGEIVEELAKYPIVLVEEKPRRVFNVVVDSVNDRTFRREELLDFELEGKGEIKVRGKLDSTEVFDVGVLLEVKDASGNLVVESRLEKRRTPGSFEVKSTIDKPGEYVVLLRAEESEGYSVSIPVARVKVKGEVCTENEVDVGRLSEIISSPVVKAELKSVEIKGKLSRAVVHELSDVLKLLNSYDVRVTGYLETREKEEDIRVHFRNKRTDVASKIITAIGPVDMEVDLRLDGLTLSKLRELDKVSRTLLDPHKPLASITKIRVRECKRI